MFVYFQLLIQVLVNFWAISTLICTQGKKSARFHVVCACASVYILIRDQGKCVDVVYLNREGKYNHTCVVGLQNGALSSSNARQVVFSILKQHVKCKTYDGLYGRGLFPF